MRSLLKKHYLRRRVNVLSIGYLTVLENHPQILYLFTTVLLRSSFILLLETTEKFITGSSCRIIKESSSILLYK
jgi:hypothetical protein